MFTLEYCTNPRNNKREKTDISYSDDIDESFERVRTLLENYIYLIDMFTIVESCYDDLDKTIIKKNCFWKVTKALLNYFGAIYSLKELAGSFTPSITNVTEKYYKKNSWYRFICDLRNIVVHHSVIAADYNQSDAFIEIEKVTAILLDNKDKAKKQNKIQKENNIQRQLDYIEKLKNDSFIRSDKHYYGIKKLSKNAQIEILQMKNDVLDYAYENGIKQQLDWLFSKTIKKDDIYQYVFIVNMESNPPKCWEPNYILESFYFSMKNMLSKASPTVFHKIEELFDDKQYNVFLS